jgi:hypothetical protein
MRTDAVSCQWFGPIKLGVLLAVLALPKPASSADEAVTPIPLHESTGGDIVLTSTAPGANAQFRYGISPGTPLNSVPQATTAVEGPPPAEPGHPAGAPPAPNYPALPILINDAFISVRAAAFYDSTRMDPKAAGYFYTSAIPVRDDPYYGTSGRASVQGTGTAVGLSFGVPNSDLNGRVVLQASALTPDQFELGLPQAFFQWERFTIGATDSTFTDLVTLPESIDLAGPAGRPAIYSGKTTQAQIRYEYLAPAEARGFFGNVAIEMPSADVNLPVPPNGTPARSPLRYSTFARYPDMVATLRYQDGDLVKDPCSETVFVSERWHIQAGGVVRDLGVENADASLRQTTTGWGTQLSGRVRVFNVERDCSELSDYVMFTTTWGSGIGHYFADLRSISAVNDAAYTPGELNALPIFAYYVGYQHDWTACLRSTAVYSHIDLDTSVSTAAAPYRRGNYYSVNLILHSEPCIRPNAATPGALHAFMTGIEYLYGDREDSGGNIGSAQRIMLILAASK